MVVGGGVGGRGRSGLCRRGGLYLLLPLDEFLQFLVVVLTEIATDGLDKE